MDARLNTFSDELCQVKTCVGRIARCQVAMGGYTTASPSLPTSEDEDGDDDADVFMFIRMMMLALPALTRCLLDTLTLCHL